MKKSFLILLGLSSMASLLIGCESTREQFDFSKKAPDEFAVVTRAPLAMPSEFTLPPPRPGAQRPQEKTADEMARETVLGETSPPPSSPMAISAGETLLLQKMGGATANPSIRETIDKETAEIEEQESPGINKLKKMIGADVEPPAKVIDPVAETLRIKKNKEQGKPATFGKSISRED